MQNDAYARLRHATREGDLDAADLLITEALRRSDPAGQLEATLALELATDTPRDDPAPFSRTLWTQLAHLLSAWDRDDTSGLDAMVDWLDTQLSQLQGFTHDVITTPTAWVTALYRGTSHPGLRLCRVLELVPPGKFPPFRLAQPLRTLFTSPHLGAITHLTLHFDPARQAPLIDPDALRALAHWPQLPHLQHIALPRQALDDDALDLLLTLPLPQLHTLDLGWNALTDRGLDTLTRTLPWPRLRHLSLAGNTAIEAAALHNPRDLRALRTLASLDLSSCHIYSTETLRNLDALTAPTVTTLHNPGHRIAARLERFRQQNPDFLDDYDGSWE